MSEKIVLSAEDGHRLAAWRGDAVGTAKGGIVVLHAVFGLTTHMSDVCDGWAANSYTAVAPALFDRLGENIVHPYATDGTIAGAKCYAALDKAGILADITACRAALRDAGRVAVSGFCTGGSWAWTAAARQDFDAQINFYGSHVHERLSQTPNCPTIIHYGAADHVVSLAEVERIRAAHPKLEMHVYAGAGHAFMNPEQPYYDSEAASLAWRRSVDFADRHLARKSIKCRD